MTQATCSTPFSVSKTRSWKGSGICRFRLLGLGGRVLAGCKALGVQSLEVRRRRGPQPWRLKIQQNVRELNV